MYDLLQAENITKSFGELVLFNNVSISIPKGRKTALLAKNGAGKTTLLRILAGEESSDSGKVVLRNDVSIGYLPQNPVFKAGATVFEVVYGTFSDVHQMFVAYEKAVAENDKDKMSELSVKLDAAGAWDIETRVNQALGHLGIEHPQKKMTELSGGQKKRVALASLIVRNPDLIILDEPTNHLDLDMIEWLEEFLNNRCQTLLMVTHDRYFLDRVCNEIIELDNQQLYVYKGNYTYFLEKRDERIQNFNAEVDKARNLLRIELEWMRRMPKARSTKAKSRIDAFYDLQEVATQTRHDESVKINISASRLGKKILEIAYINKSFGEQKLIKDFTYIFRRLEKVGIVGPNGCGKTTLLNIIAGEIQADSGKFEFGETVKVGYYKQDDPVFPQDKKVIDMVRDYADVVTLSDGNKMSVSQFLNYFLFPPSMQQQYVYKLSGGEIRRLYLVTILMQNPNFLILDEPTNNLDIMTLQVLENYLASYPGCVLTVSHDRFFLDKVADHIFVFKGEGVIKDYPGNYSDYYDIMQAEEKAAKKAKQAETTKQTKTTQISGDYSTRLTFNEKREKEQLEKDIEKLSQEKTESEEKMNHGNLPAEELVIISKRYAEIIDILDEKEMRWLELSEKRE
ncbi:MAG: ABC transporter [Bacteroidetes bacterium HGW-Bacteroidetes-21]|jgi:ATP-binding cassette subfamily F protein uup|nr:MAG: ABC transporter [Bacteroidetes bacterium HGW-Bacteroidetes-21]